MDIVQLVNIPRIRLEPKVPIPSRGRSDLRTDLAAEASVGITAASWGDRTAQWAERRLRRSTLLAIGSDRKFGRYKTAEMHAAPLWLVGRHRLNRRRYSHRAWPLNSQVLSVLQIVGVSIMRRRDGLLFSGLLDVLRGGFEASLIQEKPARRGGHLKTGSAFARPAARGAVCRPPMEPCDPRSQVRDPWSIESTKPLSLGVISYETLQDGRATIPRPHPGRHIRVPAVRQM